MKGEDHRVLEDQTIKEQRSEDVGKEAGSKGAGGAESRKVGEGARSSGAGGSNDKGAEIWRCR